MQNNGLLFPVPNIKSFPLIVLMVFFEHFFSFDNSRSYISVKHF